MGPVLGEDTNSSGFINNYGVVTEDKGVDPVSVPSVLVEDSFIDVSTCIGGSVKKKKKVHHDPWRYLYHIGIIPVYWK